MSSRWTVIFILVLLLGWYFRPDRKKIKAPQPPPPAFQEKIVKEEIKPPPLPAATHATKLPEKSAAVVQPITFSKSAPPQAVYFQVKEGWAVAQGDLLLGKPTNEARDLRGGYFKADKMKTWPSTEIAVILDPRLPDPDRIDQALREIEAVSPFRFVAFTNQPDGLIFEQADELCASYLGRVGGFQPIILARHCNKQQIMHEVLHALGFPHEHSRPERDRFVTVTWDNILEDFRPQFEVIPREMLPVTFPPGFDYNSIMLYPSNAFAKSGELVTLQSLDSSRAVAPVQDGLSGEDIRRLNWLARSAKSPVSKEGDRNNPGPQKD